jgi:small subunit ribosomal protein S20
MANHISAEKRIRRNKRRADVAGQRRNRVRTFIKKVEAAITAKNKEEALSSFKIAESEMMKAVRKNIFILKLQLVKISRLSKNIKALA